MITIFGLLVVAVVVWLVWGWRLFHKRPTLGKMDKSWLNDHQRSRSGGRRG